MICPMMQGKTLLWGQSMPYMVEVRDSKIALLQPGAVGRSSTLLGISVANRMEHQKRSAG